MFIYQFVEKMQTFFYTAFFVPWLSSDFEYIKKIPSKQICRLRIAIQFARLQWQNLINVVSDKKQKIRFSFFVSMLQTKHIAAPNTNSTIRTWCLSLSFTNFELCNIWLRKHDAIYTTKFI